MIFGLCAAGGWFGLDVLDHGEAADVPAALPDAAAGGDCHAGDPPE